MKKKEYIQPQTKITLLQTENLLAALSGTDGDDPNGGKPEVPGYGGNSEGDDAAKKYNFNSWSTWDD